MEALEALNQYLLLLLSRGGGGRTAAATGGAGVLQRVARHQLRARLK